MRSSWKLWLVGMLTAPSLLFQGQPAAADFLDFTYVQTSSTDNAPQYLNIPPLLKMELLIDAPGPANGFSITGHSAQSGGSCTVSPLLSNSCYYTGDVSEFVRFSYALFAIDGADGYYTPTTIDGSTISIEIGPNGISGYLHDDLQADINFDESGATSILTDGNPCFYGCTSTGYWTETDTPTPEPTTISLLTGGLCGLVLGLAARRVRD
jgi:hypothetical protein